MKPVAVSLCFLGCLLAAAMGFSAKTRLQTTRLDEEKDLMASLLRQPHFDTVGYYTDQPSSEFLVHARFLLAPKVLVPVTRYDSSTCFIKFSNPTGIPLSRLRILWEAVDSSGYYALTVPKP